MEINNNILEQVSLSGKTVLIRLGVNVPVKDGKVVNDFRIRKVLPTLEYLVEQGAKVVAISHIENKEGSSLRPVADYLNEILPVRFVEDWDVNNVKGKVGHISEGEVVLLENLRFHSAEKENDNEFARVLSSLADLYVNEAFSVSHRMHTSIVGVPKFIPGYEGFLFRSERENLSKAFDPLHPFLFVLGGAKFSTKIPLIEKFVNRAEKIFVGGALAHSFFDAQGMSVGQSLLEVVENEIIERLLKSNSVILPTDVVVYDSENDKHRVTKPSEVRDNEMIVDAGPETVKILSAEVTKSKFVVWNGPLGNYEKGFDGATVDLAKALSSSQAYSLVGGGDTVAAVSAIGSEDSFSFLSSGGGAMLDFLSSETLPGIEALKGSQ